MKAAVSGAHHVGKTTLIGEIVAARPSFTTVDEPYYLLEEEGHAFAEVPSLEDFERQLERAIEAVTESDGDCIFDRSPADFLAYLATHEDADAFDLGRWLPAVRESMQRLDLIVFVPIEDPDRVAPPPSEEGDLRERVDEELRDIVLQDRWTFGVPAIEVTGSPAERARRVVAHLDASAPR